MITRMVKIFLLVFFACVANIVANNEEIFDKLELALEGYRKNRSVSSFTETLQQFDFSHLVRRTESSETNYGYSAPTEDNAICPLCYTLANFLIDERRNNVSQDLLALEAAVVCTLLGIESAEICRGIIDENIPIFVHLFDENPELKGERVCDIILQNSGCSSTTFEWTVDIPVGVTVPRKNPSNPESSFNILILSDLHYDPNYTVGKAKDCSAPVCCQSDQLDGNVDDGTACGYWSEYVHTDASEALIDEALRKAKEQSDFDYVYVLGDIISHRVWSTSVENNEKDLKLIYRKMKKVFDGKPVYPILGNHEPSPLNEYHIGDNVDESLKTDWLYRLLVSEFSEWLPKSAKEDLMRGGFYTVSPRPGFRIIALNSNVANVENWWLIHDDRDPYGQLAWFAKTLKDAEDNGEIVHVLSHIPSGKSDILKVWSREYHKIIERFSNTIGAQFNGHTHRDQFMVFYSSSNTTEAISVALNGASINCDKANPNFKYISVDNDNFDVIDSEQWTFNLTEANLNNNQTPNWFKLYSFRDQYGINSLAPSAFTELLPRMATNHSLLYDYHVFVYRNSDIAIQMGCDNDCKRNYLCDISISQVGDRTQCDWLVQVFNDHI